jgi:CubicO group peptidase (beta-lactamase class C family)
MMAETEEGGSMSTPAEVGFAPDLGECFEIARQAGTLPNLHGIVAMRGDRILFERYFAGPDAGLGKPLGVVRFGPETLHDLRSVTKSIVGLLYGIALAAGHVPAPEAYLLEQFPEYPALVDEPARRALTVRHALTMTLGTEWDEFTFPYSDLRNSEIAMDRAPDRCRYVLERPVVGPPGVRWTYNGGATALLGRLIAKGTKRPLHEFARAALFEPLQITRTEWHQGTDGEVKAASGLRMTPRDLARIGVMVLGGGQWNGRQVIPAEWLAACFTPAVPMPDGHHYGYQWYLGTVPKDDGASGVRREQTISAMGNGGQRLFLLPRQELVVAVTAGNYDMPDGWRPPMVVLRDLLVPALETGRLTAGHNS